MSALTLTAEQINAWVGLVLWPMFRIAGLLSIMPALGGGEVPVRVRIALAFLLTVLIAPTLGAMPEVDPLSADSIFISLNMQKCLLYIRTWQTHIQKNQLLWSDFRFRRSQYACPL